MSTNTLDELWNSPANQPDAAAGEKIAAQFLARLRSRRRFRAWWLGWTLLALTAVTALAIHAIVRKGVGPGGAGVWTMFPLLALPWFVALRFAREFFRNGNERARAGLPLRDTLAIARASNTGERRRLVVVAALFVVMVPLLALAVWQLHVSGKASLNEAWSMGLVFAVALGLGAAGVAWRFFRRLGPERRTIDALLCDLDDSAAR